MTDRQTAEIARALQQKARELYRLAKLAIDAGFISTECDLFLEGIANDLDSLKREKDWSVNCGALGAPLYDFTPRLRRGFNGALKPHKRKALKCSTSPPSLL